MDLPRSLADLRRHGGFAPRSVKAELRANAAAALRAGRRPGDILPGLVGYDETVLPQVINAILAGHDLLLLGLRGQAKTRIARCLAGLLDERIPVLAGDPLRSHPLAPLGPQAADIIKAGGDGAEVAWLGRDERYAEKLATPDVSVADLIGDLDPIRAQREGLDLGDLRAVTFGLLPRSNRGLFCINELPDLAARIQVSLFNILEENDIQVRGIPLRLPLDLMLVFTANPEDYTARGQIVTPLKDRIGAQVLTHYPRSRAEGVAIQVQEARLHGEEGCRPQIDLLFPALIEEAARAARASEFVDRSSGVSARLTISALEALHANVLARGLLNQDPAPAARLVDLPALLPAMTGKLELAYEGEQEGPLKVGWQVLGEALRAWWAAQGLPALAEEGGDEREGPWKSVLRFFANGGRLVLDDRCPQAEHAARLGAVPDLERLAGRYLPGLDAVLGMELVIEGLFHGGLVAREESGRGYAYGDLLSTLMKRPSARRRGQGGG